jgi:hypothetical protein
MKVQIADRCFTTLAVGLRSAVVWEPTGRYTFPTQETGPRLASAATVGVGNGGPGSRSGTALAEGSRDRRAVVNKEKATTRDRRTRHGNRLAGFGSAAFRRHHRLLAMTASILAINSRDLAIIITRVTQRWFLALPLWFPRTRAAHDG